MTSADKPDTSDVPTESDREERAVATASPSVVSERATDTTEKTAGPNGTNGTKKPEPPKPEPKQPEPRKPEVKKPEATVPEAKTQPAAAKPRARADEPEPPTVITASVSEPDVSSATPPWQRVATDAAYVGDHETSKESPFSEWGYQRSPRSDAYSDSSADAADALSGGVVSGTASPSMFAAAAGQSSVRPDARPTTDPTGRTTVNFGAVRSSARPATGGPAPSALRRPGRGPRRASLQVKRVDPWSVLKLAFVLSVALFFVWLVAVGVLYGVLDGMGVWDRVNGTYNEFAQNTSSGSSGPLITASRVFGIAAIIGAINIVLFTALATVGSFVYNVSADLAGGLEITLAERE